MANITIAPIIFLSEKVLAKVLMAVKPISVIIVERSICKMLAVREVENTASGKIKVGRLAIKQKEALYVLRYS